MFLDYYGLRQLPFGVTPDPRFYYASRSHREALASLTYAVECRTGFAALVAEPGMGKTMLLRRLLQTFELRARTAFLLDTDASVHPLAAVLNELGVATEATDGLTWFTKLKEIIIQENRAGRFVLLIIDEAQNLEPAALESIRLLSNFESDEAKLLQIVLGGQPRLAEKLCAADLRQLHQRIPIGSSLQPLDRTETELYVAHRLKVAGYTGLPLFTPEALDMVAHESGGIPRQINSLCFNALSLACALRRRQADTEVMGEVLHDFCWAQRIAVQQQAAVQQKPWCAETTHDATKPSQVQRVQAAQAVAGDQGRPRVMGRAPFPAGVPLTARPPAHIAGTVRRPAKLVQARSSVASPSVALAKSTVAAQRAATEATGRAHYNHPALVASTAGMITLILILLARQTDSGSAVISWASAQVKSAFKAESSTVPALQANTNPQHGSPAIPTLIRPGRGRAPATVKSSTPSLRVAGQPDSVTTRARDAGKRADTRYGAASDAREVPIGQLHKPVIPVAGRHTEVILEPDVVPKVGTRSFVSAEMPPGPPLFGTDLHGATPVLASAPASSHISSGARPAVVVRKVIPAYPEIAKRSGIQGTVMLEAVVDTQGRVKQVRALRGPALLVDVASKGLKQWRYQPAVLNGQPVESTVQVSIYFKMSPSN